MDGRSTPCSGTPTATSRKSSTFPSAPTTSVAPGPPDQGQPTRFFPGIFYGVFAVALPKDQPKTEVTWTLTANGQTLSIPASLDPLYLISPQRETGSRLSRQHPAGPEIRSGGRPGAGTARHRRRPHGHRIASPRRSMSGSPTMVCRRRGEPGRLCLASTSGAGGWRCSWQVYRGAGAARFSDQAPAVEQGKARTTVTFSEPGDLHAAPAGSRFADAHQLLLDERLRQGHGGGGRKGGERPTFAVAPRLHRCMMSWHVPPPVRRWTLLEPGDARSKEHGT